MKASMYALLVTVMLFWAVSCTSDRSARSGLEAGEPDSSLTSRADGDSAQLAYELSQSKWCSNDAACSLVLHLSEGEDSCGDFAERLELLRTKNLVQNGWNLKGDEPVTKGTLAYMLCRALDIKGGLFMHLLPSRRYAYREAVYQELMRVGSELEPLTGPEAVGVVGRAARMKQNNQ